MKHVKDFEGLARSGLKVSVCHKKNGLEMTLGGHFR